MPYCSHSNSKSKSQSKSDSKGNGKSNTAYLIPINDIYTVSTVPAGDKGLRGCFPWACPSRDVDPRRAVGGGGGGWKGGGGGGGGGGGELLS